jgi:sarcosine oxidase delta subunit
MSDNKLTDERGLYQLPDEPDAAPEPSVSAPVSALGRAGVPLRECPFCGDRAIVEKIHEWDAAIAISCNNGDCRASQWHHPDYPFTETEAREAWNRRDGEAARLAEAVAAERARIVAALEAAKDHQVMSWGEVTMPVWKVVEIIEDAP